MASFALRVPWLAHAHEEKSVCFLGLATYPCLQRRAARAADARGHRCCGCDYRLPASLPDINCPGSVLLRDVRRKPRRSALLGCVDDGKAKSPDSSALVQLQRSCGKVLPVPPNGASPKASWFVQCDFFPGKSELHTSSHCGATA